MFNIGDRVKCINVNGLVDGIKNPKLVLNREYIIYGAKVNSCGCISLDVGLIQDENTEVHCYIHNQVIGLALIGCIQWCNSNRFIKVQEQKQYIAVQSNVEVIEEELQLN